MPADATGAHAIHTALLGGQRTLTALSSGDNAVTPPTTAQWCRIELDEASTVAVNLQQTGADVGFRLSRRGPTIICVDFLTTTTFNLESVSAGCNVWLTFGRFN